MKAMPLVGIRKFEFRPDYPDPPRGPGRTLLKVTHVGLNRLDLLVADGTLSLELPRICGADVVGVVETCESGAFKVGTRVLLNPALPQDGDIWPGSRECPYVRILGAHLDGGMADYISVADSQVYEIPDHLDDLEAVTIPLDYLTAWRMLHTKARLGPGESVLIWGAAGPLGCAAIKICKYLGARPTAVSGRKEDEQVLLALGATAWLNYTAADFDEQLRAEAREGFDVIFESVGSASWSDSVAVSRQGARIVVCGVTSGKDATTDLEAVYYKQITVFGSRMGYPDEFESMLEAVQSRNLEPGIVLDVFSIRDAAVAIEAIASRAAPGKVVLRNDL